jgi:hypothetical protein
MKTCWRRSGDGGCQEQWNRLFRWYEEKSDDQDYQFTYGSGNTAFTIENNPEPGSLWLVMLAGAAFFVKSRIRRSPAAV